MLLVVGILIVCHAIWCISSGTVYRSGSESGRIGGNQKGQYLVTKIHRSFGWSSVYKLESAYYLRAGGCICIIS